MIVKVVIAIVGMSMSLLTGAEEHSACRNPLADYTNHSSSELSTIASSCKSPAVANLFFNRASQNDLEELDHVYSSLIPYRPRGDRHHFDSYQMFITLVEVFAGENSQSVEENTVEKLNSVYDIAGEIAELRLRGYDLQADALEREAWTKYR